MNKIVVTERQIAEGRQMEVLDLTSSLTASLNSLREYLEQPSEQINHDAREFNPEQLLDKIQQGMEQRDMDVVTNTLGTWTKDNLLDLLYELEYQRFMDIKLHTSDVFHKIILPHLLKREQKDGVIYTVAYGNVASVIDIKTMSILIHLYNENGITTGRAAAQNTDIAYFNSDTTREGLSKVIKLRKPMEVTSTCIEDVIEELTKDDGTTINRQRKRMLKYHRAKLVLGDMTLDGEPFRPASDSAAVAIKNLATGLVVNRLSPKGKRYYIAIQDNDLSFMVNTAIWEIYYSLQTRVPKNIPHVIDKSFPENKLVLYSLGESVDATFLRQLPAQLLKDGRGEAKRLLTAYSVCVGMVESNCIESRELKLSLRLLIGSGWSQESGVKVDYNHIFAEQPKGVTTKRTTEQLFLPQTVHNNQRIFIPAEHSWDLIHPSRANYWLGKDMAEEALPIHWHDL